MKRLAYLFVTAALLSVGLVVTAGPVAAADPSVSVQGCQATILNVPEGAATLITGTVNNQDFSTTDNPATLVSGDYHWAVTLNGDPVASGDFTIGEGCPPASPSPSPVASPSPSPTTVPCGSTASAARCPSPTPRSTPKPPTTGVGSNNAIPWGVILAVLVAVGLINGGLFLAAKRRS